MAIVCTTVSGGYCGIGWSDVGSMVGSDAVIGSVSPTPAIEDYILHQQTPPIAGSCPNAVCPESLPVFAGNCSNNVQNVSGSAINGYIVLEFSRPINASDSCDKDVKDGAIIWSAGSGAVPVGIIQHSFRDFIAYVPGDPNNPGFVWFRTLPPPTTSVATTSIPGVDTNDSPTTAQGTTGQATTAQATTAQATTAQATTGQSTTGGIVVNTTQTNNVVNASSSGKYGLSLWAVILIIVIVICAVCICVSLAAACIMKHRKRANQHKGNFY